MTEILLLFQALGAGVIALGAGHALGALRRREPEAARLALAEAILQALGLFLAGTLIRLIQQLDWPQLALIAATLLMRTTLKAIFSRERRLASRRLL